VTESATVVGPIGIPDTSFAPRDPTIPSKQLSANEIYADRFGRVKVQFHWDREGKLNENSSCWVRVVQTWSGAGFGFQFIPRVGMEVLVTFLAGDPDRPVVIGCLYNATHATPDPLPQRLTRSGIRTQSSPGGGGFNEVSFEDQKGVERVYIHAQKDFDEVVNDGHSLDVKGNEKITIGRDQEVGVAGDQVVGVGGRRAVLVGGDESEAVRGSRVLTVARHETTRVGGDVLHDVEGVATRTVAADDLTVIGGDRSLTVRGSSITHVGGKSADEKASAITFVQGSSFHTVTERALVKAGDKGALRLECGKSFIEISGDKITLSAQTVEVLGGDAVTMKGKGGGASFDQEGARIQGDPVMVRTSKGSSLALDGQHATVNAPGKATVAGKSVDLKSSKDGSSSSPAGGGGGDKPKNLKLVFTHLRITDGDNRLAGASYRVVVEDQVHQGETDAQGEIQVWAPPTAKVAHVVLWPSAKHASLHPGGPLTWLVRIVPDLGDASAVTGARLRLRNLGYAPSTAITGAELDDLTQDAVVEFQFDVRLAVSAALDDDTKNQLADAYGKPL
jgi:type VI secretion system secreted protein VgrG